ncbi:phytanoyl-CoA dioxygenase family protein [Streptomyces sp. NPDC001739]
MIRGIEEVRKNIGHEVFALIYDEFWNTIIEKRPLLESLMGPQVRAVPLPYVNYVPAGDAGFKPHRDRYHDPLAADGSPNMMTVWFALTDAGTERGCLSVLPSNVDPSFPDNLQKFHVTDLRNLRALPVTSGDAVIFNQALMHWGTRNVSSEPRISFAIEIERAGSPAARSPYLMLETLPSFEERVGFIGAVIGGLRRNNISFGDEHVDLGRNMCESVHGSRFKHLWED